MTIEDIKAVYFVGAGGIGMSALIRYFLSKGKFVAGYDLHASPLTKQLEEEGAAIHYEDKVELIPSCCTDKEQTLVVYTPAIPASHTELSFFRTEGFEIVKRAAVLGTITRSSRGLCIAGTHGKTTTSSMVAHLLKQSEVDCNAFLGGILKNYDSNLLLSDKSDLTVIEADEFDRSFHQLDPYMAVITSADPDHLDIYGTAESYRESFEHFTSLIRPGGLLLMRKGIAVSPRLQAGVSLKTYGMDAQCDYYAENILVGKGEIHFDFVAPSFRIEHISLGVPLRINVENAVAAITIATLNGATPAEVKHAISTYSGAQRRFDFHLKTDKIVLIDDYAHHPEELKASIQSVKELYAGKHICGIFQPHLYTRTRDFAADFAQSLSAVDQLILLDIYPAREEPIEGVSSQLIFDKVCLENKVCCRKEELVDLMKKGQYEVVLMVGAGDIEQLIAPVKQLLEENYLPTNEQPLP